MGKKAKSALFRLVIIFSGEINWNREITIYW